MAKKVLLVSPLRNYSMERSMGNEMYPSGALLLLGTMLKEQGYTVKVVHMVADKVDQYTLASILTDFDPDIVNITVSTYQTMWTKTVSGLAKAHNRKTTVIAGGSHPTALKGEFLAAFPDVDIVVYGEGEKSLLALVSGEPLSAINGICYRDNGKTITNEPRPLLTVGELDALPYPDKSLVDFNRYAGLYPVGRRPSMFIMSSRGCPYSCLQGDTLIDTLEGMTPIRELVGLSGVKVLTRNPNTLVPEYADAPVIAKTGTNRALVRVRFDDGTHIDCTPDHRFKVFKNGNQFCDIRERDIEAKDLEQGQSVRAVKYDIHPTLGYVDVVYGRHKRIKQHRLVMEGVLRRQLSVKDVIHHIDRCKTNNAISNLALTDNASHVPNYHPEISERMKNDNPMCRPAVQRKMSETMKRLCSEGVIIPFMCTADGINIIREIARKRGFSDANPAKVARRKRLAEINHKVVSVETPKDREDVYCLQVPDYDWFYANGVLVHNCTFCSKTIYGNTLRLRSPENIMEEVEHLYHNWGVREIHFGDDTFNANLNWAHELLDLIISRGYHKKLVFRVALRANQGIINYELLNHLKSAGVWFAMLGVENGNQAMLDHMKKGITVPEVKRAFKMLHEVGIKTEAFFIVGMPGETAQTIEDSYRLYKEIKPYWGGFSRAMPFPGTGLTEELRESGNLLCEDYDQFGPSCKAVRTDAMSADDIEKAVDVLEKMARRDKMKHPKQLMYAVKDKFLRR